MLIIDVTKEKNIEAALRLYKKKVQRTKQMQNLQQRKEYTKPSVRKRNIIQKAKYQNKFK